MPEWDSEVEVDEALARALVGDTYPALVTESFRPLGVGWDNTAWLADENVVFRFPRREIALPGILREMVVLPQIAPRLPFAIPDAAYPGAPSELFPWPWFGSRLIPGHEIHEHGGLHEDSRQALAHDLGVFLRALHTIHVPIDADLPVDPNGRADMSARVPRTRLSLLELDRSGTLGARAAGILDAAESLPPTDRLVLAHGDLHFRHALINDHGGLAGIIDWGDVCLSAAGIDLSLYWSLLPPTARAAFRSAYGEISEENLIRARVLALSLSALLALYGRDQNMRGVEREALHGIERTLTD
jgi:aminoglycoside phosphotransferase (APT) family kinase protein